MDRKEKEREEAERARSVEQNVRALQQRMGRRYSRDRVSLDNFRIDYRQQQSALDAVRRFADSLRFDCGLVLYGSVGTGKDHLLAATLYRAIESGLTVAWVNGQEIYARFRDAMDTHASEAQIMADFVRPAVLGISDPIPPVIDPNKPAAWRTELLFRVLDARYRDCKSTWATLNCQSPEDAESKLSEPVFDRLKDGSVLVPCFWPSFREFKHLEKP